MIRSLVWRRTHARHAAAVAIVFSLPFAGIALPASPVRAQASLESAVAGVAVPSGAERVNDASLTRGLGKLMSAGAKEFGLPVGKDEPAEVYFWSGARYKPGRAPFLKTMLRNALTEAGYTIKEVDSSSENTPNAFDEEAYGTGALQLGSADPRHAYFHATNAAKGTTIVGVWFDQESQKRLVLALGRVGFAAPPPETKAPAVTGADVWLVKDLQHATKGMPPSPTPAFAALAPKPGTVRGRVLDSGGKPIAGAQIVAWSSAAGGFRTSTKGKTNAQGVYEIPLPVGIGQVVNADARVEYNGASLLLPLHPVDGERDNFDSKKGHVENFVLRASGPAGEGGTNSYGAPMRVLTWDIPEGAIVEVTLKPAGPLLDGRAGKTLVFRYPVKGVLTTETYFGDIPIGRYTLTAKVYDGEDALPLRVKQTFSQEDTLHASLTVDFEAESDQLASLDRTGIKRYEITLKP